MVTQHNILIHNFFLRLLFIPGITGITHHTFSQTSWVPPIGIPSPAFGIMDTAPAIPNPWNNPIAGFYYIDRSGSCSDATGGTPLQPRCTVPGSLQAGDVVEIHGTYDCSCSQITINGSGTSIQPIFVRGGDSDSMPLIKNPLKIQGDYIITENLNMINKVTLLAPHHHIAFRNSKVHNFDSYGIGISNWTGDTANKISDVVIYNNHIHHCGRFEPDSSFTNEERDTHGITPQEGSERVWILDNKIEWNQGDGIQVQRARKIYIGRNTIGRHGENAIDLKVPQDVIVSQNTMHGFYPKILTGEGGGNGEAITAHKALADPIVMPYPKRIWFLYNDISDAQFGIVAEDGDNIYAIGNVIHNIRVMQTDAHSNDSPWRYGAGIQFNGKAIGIFNNNIYETTLGIGTVVNGNTQLSIRNNIISNMWTGNDYPISVIAQGTGSSLAFSQAKFSNNLFWQNGNPILIRWNGGPYNTSQLQALGTCSGCITADPFYVNSSTDNFHLQASSIAINGGVQDSIYMLFSNLYSVQNIEKDFDKIPRPQGLAWDIGAYEFVNCAPYNVNLGNDTAFCLGNSLQLNAGNHQSYVWSTGSTTQTMLVNSSSVIWVSVTDTLGCSSTDTINVIVNPLPSVTQSLFSTVCINTPAFVLIGGSPAGGTYSGTGVSGNKFTASIAGVGTHTIAYTYTDSNGCSNYSQQTIIVNSCTGLQEEAGINSLSIYPNPSDGAITLNLTMSSLQTTVINITNELNQIIYSLQLNNISNHVCNIDLSDQPKGLYFMHLITNSGTVSRKIIKD